MYKLFPSFGEKIKVDVCYKSPVQTLIILNSSHLCHALQKWYGKQPNGWVRGFKIITTV